MLYHTIKINAVEVRPCDGGFEVTVEGREINPAQEKMLRDLFPDTQDLIVQVLQKQALLKALF